MSWTVVALKDFRDASRSRLLWVLTALFVLVVGGLAYGYTEFLPGDGVSPDPSLGFIVFLQGPAAFFVSIAAILVGYKSIAGERESGTITFLLGLPHSRLEVVLGKLVGRTAVIAVALLAGFSVAAVTLLALGASFSGVQYLLFSTLTVYYALAFVGVAVGLSALTRSSAKAAAGAVTFWVVNRFWGVVPLVVLVLVNGFTFPEPPFPAWYHALVGIGPGAAYGNAAAYFLPEAFGRRVSTEFGRLPPWYGLVVLAVWTVLPVVFGFLRFDRADLT